MNVLELLGSMGGVAGGAALAGRAPAVQAVQLPKKPSAKKKPASMVPSGQNPPSQAPTRAPALRTVDAILASRPSAPTPPAPVAAAPQSGTTADPARMASTLGRYTDAATAEMRGKQNEAEALLQSQMGAIGDDPAWRALRTLAMRRAQNPGYSKTLLDQMRGRQSARNAAAAAGAARNAMQHMARGNVNGAAAMTALQRGQNRAGINDRNAQLGIDQMAAEAEMRDKGSALGQAAGLVGQENADNQRMALALANVKQGYNPLSWLAQIQRMQDPLQQLGQAVGLRGY